MGRFINADDYISTGQGLVSRNVFAYCLNNPTNYVDRNGTFPWLLAGIVAIAAVVIIGIDHTLKANQPEGGFAAINDQKDNGTVKKIGYVEGGGFSVDQNGMTLCDLEAGLASLTVVTEHFEVEVLDCLTGSAKAEIDWSGIPSVDISASAAIYSPSIIFTLPLGVFEITIEAEGLIGGVGIGLELDPDNGRIKVTPPTVGMGASYCIDINLRD